MNYLVTGGAGFIGVNLVKQLLLDGHQVTVLDNYAAGKFADRHHTGARYVEGDIRDRALVRSLMTGMDGVFHLAALPRVLYTIEHPEEAHDVNVNGTMIVLSTAKEAGVKRVVFSSSGATYGEKEEAILTEQTPKEPTSPYAVHKLMGEQYCQLFANLYRLETVTLVYSNVYGPSFDPDGAYALVVGKFIDQRKKGLALPICGDGEYYRDYVHVSDVVRANIMAMHSPAVGKGEVINISTGVATSVNELARIIGGETKTVAPRVGDLRRTVLANDKAKSVFGWVPTIYVPEGIIALMNETLDAQAVTPPSLQIHPRTRLNQREKKAKQLVKLAVQ